MPCCVKAWEMFLAIRHRAFAPRAPEGPDDPMFSWYREDLTRAFRACFGATGKSMRKSGAEKLWRSTQSLDLVRRWGRWGDKSPVPGLHYVQPQSTLPHGVQDAWLTARIN